MPQTISLVLTTGDHFCAILDMARPEESWKLSCVEAILKWNIGPGILQTQTAIWQCCEEFVTGEKMKANKPVAVDFLTSKELHQTVRESGLGRVVLTVSTPVTGFNLTNLLIQHYPISLSVHIICKTT